MFQASRAAQPHHGAAEVAQAKLALGKHTMVGASAGPVAQAKAGGGGGGGGDGVALPTSGGKPLPPQVLTEMNALFSKNFGSVRIFEGPEAAALGALAITQGTNIHFAPGQYDPFSAKGRKILGHELRHVVQQWDGGVKATKQAKGGVAINDDAGHEQDADMWGELAAFGDRSGVPTGAPGAGGPAGQGEVAQAKCATCDAKGGGPAAQAKGPEPQQGGEGCATCGTPLTDHADPVQAKAEEGGRAEDSIGDASGLVAQRLPGDGLNPPGDCDYATYTALRAAVTTAKAGVSALGSCAIDDSCELLAAKIAAISTEIAARIALDATCFRGGNQGHQDQIQGKVNAMNRCYKYFTDKNPPCDQQLLTMTAAVAGAVAGTAAVTTGTATAIATAALAVLQFVANTLGAVVSGLIQVLTFLLRLGNPGYA
jgi:hypothetical protein